MMRNFIAQLQTLNQSENRLLNSSVNKVRQNESNAHLTSNAHFGGFVV